MTDKTTPEFTEAIGNASEINELLRRCGVKFGIYKNGESKEHFPLRPDTESYRCGAVADIENGLIKRVDVLNNFRRDTYHDKKVVRGGITSKDCILRSCACFIPGRL